MFLRQSTSQIILFGPCLDITDGVTEETALTLVQADMRLSKDGGAFAQKSAAGNATHDSDGWYSTTLSTTDTNTVGILKLNVHQPANMLPVWETFYVVEEAVYDAIYGASAALAMGSVTGAVGSVSSGGITAASLASSTITAAKIATDAITAAKIAANAIGASEIADGAIDAGAIAAGALDGKGDWNVGKTGYALSAAGVDGILDEPIPELVAPFTWPGTLRTIIAWTGMLNRNQRKQHKTAGTQELYNDALDSAPVATATVSDDGETYTRGEFS